MVYFLVSAYPVVLEQSHWSSIIFLSNFVLNLNINCAKKDRPSDTWAAVADSQGCVEVVTNTNSTAQKAERLPRLLLQNSLHTFSQSTGRTLRSQYKILWHFLTFAAFLPMLYLPALQLKPCFDFLHQVYSHQCKCSLNEHIQNDVVINYQHCWHSFSCYKFSKLQTEYNRKKLQ